MLLGTSGGALTTGDRIAIGGDLLVLIGLALTLFVYLLQRASSAEQSRQSVLSILTAVSSGIDRWAKPHFSTDYSGDKAEERSIRDYRLVMGGGYMQNFRVPSEPLVVILHQADEGRFISQRVIEAVNVAIWRIGVFNQLVEQQTAFVAQNVVDILGESITQDRRKAIARSAQSISTHIHGAAIGNAQWYSELVDSLAENIGQLDSLGTCRWWQLRHRRPTSDVTVDVS